MMRVITSVAALAAALLLAPTPAFAGTDGHSAKVRHADLNLASADGERRFERRIAAAANRVCAVDDDTRELAIVMRQRSCVRDAVAAARPALQVAVARAKTGQVAVADAAQQ